MLKKIGTFILFLLGTFLAAASGILVMGNIGDYEGFKKPIFSPPAFVFPIVWTILYSLMAIAAYRVWLKGKEGENIKGALALYGIQLFLNFLWPIIFFNFRLYGLAFLELLLLLVFVMLTTFRFFKIDKLAGILMLPYIIWLCIAGVLNFAIWYLNS